MTPHEQQEVAQTMEPHLRTGDILYRASDARGPFGLPFSRLVGRITKSPFTHAAIACRGANGGRPGILEINETGVRLVYFTDWLRDCLGNQLVVYRLKPELWRDEMENEFLQIIVRLLERNPTYDFSFSDPDRVYCTEAVVQIYRQLNISLQPPTYLRDIASRTATWLVWAGNYLMEASGTDCRIPLDRPLCFPGDASRGMMACPHTECVFRYPEKA